MNKKFLIVGLGNIGAKYEETRHNIGFKVLDRLASRSGISFSTDRLADKAEMRIKGRTLVLIKPNTYMNLSGKALKYWMDQEKVPVENVLVIVDDVAIDYAHLRLKMRGSDGGHNGLKNIREVLGNDNYPRLRVGIGGNYPKGAQVDYVLGEWSAEEKLLMARLLERCADTIESYCLAGPSNTMNKFNGALPPEKEPEN
jgi:peptidyl-tRNA hydrolase, PTH1 family